MGNAISDQIHQERTFTDIESYFKGTTKQGIRIRVMNKDDFIDLLMRKRAFVIELPAGEVITFETTKGWYLAREEGVEFYRIFGRYSDQVSETKLPEISDQNLPAILEYSSENSICRIQI